MKSLASFFYVNCFHGVYLSIQLFSACLCLVKIFLLKATYGQGMIFRHTINTFLTGVLTFDVMINMVGIDLPTCYLFFVPFLVPLFPCACPLLNYLLLFYSILIYLHFGAIFQVCVRMCDCSRDYIITQTFTVNSELILQNLEWENLYIYRYL